MISQVNLKLQRKRIVSTLSLVLLTLVLFIFFSRFEIRNKGRGDETPYLFTPLLSGAHLKADLRPFDPNKLNEEDWINLGFTERQTATLLKYKKMLGGSFSSKEQFKKCYAVSDEMYRKLESFLMLPETSGYRKNSANFSSANKDLRVRNRFNPDHYSLSDWQKLGFSERQAASILKYKNYLGGSFQSKEKFKECFIISAENYRKLAPFLLLPEKTSARSSQSFSSFGNTTPATEKFNPNFLSLSDWMQLGFTQKQAQVILNYKEKILKGSFKSADDLKRCFVISGQKFKDLQPLLLFETSSPSDEKTLVYAKAMKKDSTDFTKVDLNRITFKQLTEFGFQEKGAASYLGFRKKLGGFVRKEQILETYNLDRELASKLINTAFLDTENVKKYNLEDAPEDWLKSHPYFRYYADRIIFYRISFSDQNKIFRKLKAKPDAEARMKDYLL